MTSIFESAQIFLGGMGSNPLIPVFGSKVPSYQYWANTVWVEQTMDIEIEQRVINLVEIDESLINDGDVILIRRMTGIDPLIMVGTGGSVGHCVLLMRVDGELYVFESQGGWHWGSPKHGV